MSEASIESVRLAAEAILQSLGSGAPSWTVLHVERASQQPAPAPDAGAIKLISKHSEMPPNLESPDSAPRLSVTLGPVNPGPDSTVTAFYLAYLPTAQAIAELASQIQDHASEAVLSRGRALPPCPGHRHPMVARALDNVPVWQCPRGGHVEPIIHTIRDS